MPEDRVFGLLRGLRAYVQADLDALLLDNCLLSPETGRPQRETLEESARPFVEQAEALLAEIDAVLPPLPPAEAVDPRQAAYEAERQAHYRRIGLVQG